MGQGVIGSPGQSPTDEFGPTIKLFPSVRLRSCALDLVAGRAALTRDDRVQVTWIGNDSRGYLRLKDADPDFPFVMDIHIEPIDPMEIDRLSSADPKGPAPPLPGRWIEQESETTQRWELFNARITSVVPVWV